MVLAYVLAKMEAGKEEEVFAEIEKHREIEEASATYGVFDLIIKVKFKKIEELDRFIFDVVRRIPGVKETVTMITAKTIV
ncbi:MAG: Lrp/AsnC family transcriptional regulator [Candidatus Bathyarchaeia archaeon]